MTVRDLAGTLPCLALLAFVGLAAAAPARAQDAAGGEPAGPRALDQGVTVKMSGRPAGASTVDESLLRYLVSRGDRPAVDAEVERLKKLDPNWQLPADLFGGQAPVDEQPLWQLYEQGDFAGVRSLIGQLRAEHADWRPPAQLLTLMEVAEVRKDMSRAATDGDWATVVRIADEHPAVVDCRNVDNLWRLAEARIRTGDKPAGYDVYARIIQTCADADHRFATLQKAKALLGQGELQRLAALEAARNDAPEQVAKVETLLAPPPPAKVAAKAPPATPSVIQQLYRPGAGVEAASAAADRVVRRRDGVAAGKIGWIYHEAGRPEDAATWFARGLEWTPSESTAQGLALSLAALGRTAELDRLAAAYPAVVLNVRGGQVAAAMDKGDAAMVLQLTERTTKPAELLMRAWSLMRLERATEASGAFQQVMDSDGLVAAQRSEAVYGLIRSQLALHLFKDAATTLDRYGLPTQKAYEIQAELLAQQAEISFGRQDYRRTVVLLEQRRDYAQPDRGLELREAWARYHLGQFTNARTIFTRLDRIIATPESQAGLDAVRRRTSIVGGV